MQQPKRDFNRFLNGGGDFLLIILSGLILCCIIALLSGCKETEFVPVTEVHHEYHHTTDSIKQVDSIIEKQTTIIREVDSATMAQYGIKLESAQRAWLVQNERLQREVEKLRQQKSDTVIVVDSIPHPYPVEVVKREQYVPSIVKILAWIGGAVSAIGIGWIAIKLFVKIKT